MSRLLRPDCASSFAEGNACHTPAGSPAGGQFCASTSFFLDPSASHPRHSSPSNAPAVTIRGDADFKVAEIAAERQFGIHLKAFTREMVQYVEGYTVTVRARQSENGDIVIHHHFASESDHATFDATRVLTIGEKDQKPYVYHALFSLSDQHQGEGLAKDFMRGSVETYLAHGLDRIELGANIDVGGYAWARYGFDGAAEADRLYATKRGLDTLSVVASYARRMRQAGTPVPEGLDETLAAAHSALTSAGDRPGATWVVADLRLKTTPEFTRGLLGTMYPNSPTAKRALRTAPDSDTLNIGALSLAGISWHGALKLDRRDPGFQRLSRYVGLK